MTTILKGMNHMLQTFKILASQNQSKIIAFVRKNPDSPYLYDAKSEMGKTVVDLENIGYQPTIFESACIDNFTSYDHERIISELSDHQKRCYFIYDELNKELFEWCNKPPKSSDELILMWKKLLKSYENLIVIEEVPQEEVLTCESVVAFAPALIKFNKEEEYRELFDEIQENPIMIVFDDCHTFRISMIEHLD